MQRGIEFSWFDLMQNCSDEQNTNNIYSENDASVDCVEYQIPRFKIIDFGSTRLGVESVDSDIDLLVTTFDCLFERLPFFHQLETKIKLVNGIENFILLKNAHIPLAKFTLNGIKVDLVFADMATPYHILRDVEETKLNRPMMLNPEYLLSESSVHNGNHKSAECLNGYLQSR